MCASRVRLIGLIAACCALGGVATAQDAWRVAADSAVERMQVAAGAGLRVTRSRSTGLATFVATRRGGGIPVSGGTPAERALAFVQEHGGAFGVREPSDLLLVETHERDTVGMERVRLRQVVNGVPVVGGELVVHLRGAQVVVANGRILPGLDDLDTSPAVTLEQAEASAQVLLAEKLGLAEARLSVPRLEVLNRGVFDGRRHPSHLAWFLEARQGDTREFIWVDAHSAAVVLHFRQAPQARDRQVYTAGGHATLPGTLVGSEASPPPSTDPDGLSAYNFLGDTYDYFNEVHGRDSFDGAGATLKAVVHYCWGGCPMRNAFWDSVQVVFGESYARDDVVAHELTHALTERTAGLYYYMQSGALNESFSDIFGETVDQWNVSRGEVARRGNDTADVRWRVGEDIPGGAARNMMNPNAYGDPGRMNDPKFQCPDSVGLDRGGVHSNSGVANHAYALMVDGGTYNGITVTGIGFDKAAKVEYRTLTQYLTSASDFRDDYDALQQSCTDLIGTSGITASDCGQVRRALEAVEMSAPWPCWLGQPVVPQLCPAGTTVSDIFYDDMETDANWTPSSSVGSTQWRHEPTGFATSGTGAFWSRYQGTESGRSLTMTPGVAIPSGDVRLQFNHSFGFENNFAYGYWFFWDGGVLEYSANGGNWQSALGLITSGAAPRGRIFYDSRNPQPLPGWTAFVGDSWGYTASQLDLSGLAGPNVRFRFTVGEDYSGADDGWWIDDFRIYRCLSAGPPALSIEGTSVREGDSGSVSALFAVTLSAPAATDVIVEYATSDGTATVAGFDYQAAAGTLTIPAGETGGAIEVVVNGGTDAEGDETFDVTLGNPVGATLATAVGVGTIRDDESALLTPSASSWAVAREGMATLRGVGYGTPGYVAVGDSGDIWTSATSASWTRRSSPTHSDLLGAAYGGPDGAKTYVVVGTRCAQDGTCGAGPAVLTSPDGITWTARDVSSVSTQDLLAVAYVPFGAPVFVAAGTGGALLTSPNGVTWTTRTSGTIATLRSVAFGAGVCAVAGDYVMLQSTGGVSWSSVGVNPAWADKMSVAYTGTTFLALGTRSDGGPDMFQSGDGLAWSWAVWIPWGTTPTGTAGHAGLLIVVGADSIYPLQTSVMSPYGYYGWTWLHPPLPAGAGQSKDLLSVAWVGSNYVAVGRRGAIYTSPTGAAWTNRQLPASRYLRAAASDGSRFCAVGDDGAVAASVDGKVWTNPAGLPPRQGVYDDWTGIAWGSGLFVAVGPTVMTSPTCSVWVDRNPKRIPPYGMDSFAYRDVIRSPSLFVAVGEKTVQSDTLPMLATSPNGTTWEQRDSSLPAGVGLDAVGYGNGRYVVIGYTRGDGRPFLATSEDGLVWDQRPAPFGFTEAVRKIAFAAGQFVATGQRTWTSADGIHWGLAPQESWQQSGLTAGSSRFVAVGNDAHESIDGNRWVPQNVPTTRGLRGAAYAASRDRFVAVGDAVIAYTNDPTPALAIGNVTLVEGDSGTTDAVLDVSLSAVSGRPIIVQYATAAGTATAGSDYLNRSGVLTFEPGVDNLTVAVPVVGETSYEADETLSVTLSNPSGATLSNAKATVTISNDDAQPTLSIGDSSVLEKDVGVSAAVFTVSLSSPSGLPVTVGWATSDGTATAGADYTASTTGTLSFSPGTSTRTLSVAAKGDLLTEGDEAFFVTLSAPVGATIADSLGQAAIVDNDIVGAFEFSSPVFTVSEAAASAMVTLIRTGGTLADGSVTYATSDGTATVAALDYTATSGTLTFAYGVTSRTVAVPILHDAVHEPAEAVILSLSAPSGTGASLGARTTAVLTISDDDPLPVLQFAATAYSATEGQPSSVTIAVRRTGNPTPAVSVDYTTVDGTATAPGDYASAAGGLSLGSGVTSLAFAVSIANDALPEPSETLRLVLSNPVGATLGTLASVPLKITDNDQGLQFSAAGYAVAESAAKAVITVKRVGGSAGTLRVDYATGGGTATPDFDYATTTGQLTFGPGQVTQTFPVTILKDTDDEGSETVGLTLTNAIPPEALGSPSSAVLTILDDQPVVQLAAAQYAVTEATPTVTASVRRLGSTQGTAMMDYQTSDGTAVDGVDYTGVSGTLTFGPGQTLTTVGVPILQDTLDEPDETFGLSLTRRGVDIAIGTPGSAVVTIKDDDSAGKLQFAVAGQSVAEVAGAAIITVTRTGGAASGVSVDYATADGMAVAGTDYLATAGTLSFGAGQSGQTFTVQVLSNPAATGNRSVNLALSAPTGGATLGTPPSAVLWIVKP